MTDRVCGPSRFLPTPSLLIEPLTTLSMPVLAVPWDSAHSRGPNSQQHRSPLQLHSHTHDLGGRRKARASGTGCPGQLPPKPQPHPQRAPSPQGLGVGSEESPAGAGL